MEKHFTTIFEPTQLTIIVNNRNKKIEGDKRNSVLLNKGFQENFNDSNRHLKMNKRL